MVYSKVEAMVRQRGYSVKELLKETEMASAMAPEMACQKERTTVPETPWVLLAGLRYWVPWLGSNFPVWALSPPVAFGAQFPIRHQMFHYLFPNPDRLLVGPAVMVFSATWNELSFHYR